MLQDAVCLANHHYRANLESAVPCSTKVWAYAHIMPNVEIGEHCIIGENAFVGEGSRIGLRCKIQARALLYSVVLEDGVFIGPGVICCNDKYPRAINPDWTLKLGGDWQKEFVYVETGASLGAGAIILPGITVGQWAVVGAGAVVAKDVPDYAVVVGNPAHVIGYTNEEGIACNDTHL